VREKPHPSRGGNAYDQAMRAAAMAGRIELGIPGLTPSVRSVERCNHRLANEGHFLPYLPHGNHRPAGLVGTDRFLLLLFRLAYPRATAAECAAFIFRNSI